MRAVASIVRAEGALFVGTVDQILQLVNRLRRETGASVVNLDNARFYILDEPLRSVKGLEEAMKGKQT